MKEVSEFEARLLRILRAVLGRGSIDQVLAWLVHPIKRPKCLSRQCVELAQDFLSKGVTSWLAESGWASTSSLRADEVVSGRLWERHSVSSLSLTFSANSLELLIWLTSENFVKPDSSLNVDASTLTTGDRLLWLKTYTSVQRTLGGPLLLKQPGFSDHGLIPLLAPWHSGLSGNMTDPNLEFWCRSEHAWVLESLQPQLVDAWVSVEKKKHTTSNHKDMRKVGLLQKLTLARLMDEAKKHARQDVCLFLLPVGHQLLKNAGTDTWFSALNVRSLKMASRSEVYQAALAYLDSIERLHAWNQHARSIGFYDEDYQSGQLWKSHWEEYHGDRLRQQALEVARRVDPVRAVTSAVENTS